MNLKKKNLVKRNKSINEISSTERENFIRSNIFSPKENMLESLKSEDNLFPCKS